MLKGKVEYRAGRTGLVKVVGSLVDSENIQHKIAGYTVSVKNKAEMNPQPGDIFDFEYELINSVACGNLIKKIN